MKISEIIIDENIYPRKNFDPETVARYREALSADATLPPLVVMPDGRLLDGRHRYEAYKQAGVEEVEVIIEEPGDPDARAVELNLRHGRPLTRGMQDIPGSAGQGRERSRDVRIIWLCACWT